MNSKNYNHRKQLESLGKSQLIDMLLQSPTPPVPPAPKKQVVVKKKLVMPPAPKNRLLLRKS